MGQAKNRGSFEQRMSQAKAEREALAERLGLEKRTLKEIKADLGVPDDAQFHGYAVHDPVRDEFLSSYSDARDAVTRQWVARPEGAKCFDDFRTQGAVFCQLFLHLRELLCTGQFVIQQQIGHFFKGTCGSQVGNGIAAIE